MRKRRLIADFELSKSIFWAWSTGKQYLGYHQLLEPQKMISLHWKWEGEGEEVHHIHWGLKAQDDKRVVKKAIELFDLADEIVMHNGDKFDLKKLYGRAMFHQLPMRPKYITRDTMKMVKSVASLPSYSLKFLCQHFGLPLKLDSGGSATWDKVQFEKSQEALDHLLFYGDGDITSTEHLFNHIKTYCLNKQHYGEEKFFCPECNGLGKWNKSYTTASKTHLHYFKCRDKSCSTYWKINNKTYMDFLQYKMVNGIK